MPGNTTSHPPPVGHYSASPATADVLIDPDPLIGDNEGKNLTTTSGVTVTPVDAASSADLATPGTSDGSAKPPTCQPTLTEMENEVSAREDRNSEASMTQDDLTMPAMVPSSSPSPTLPLPTTRGVVG